MISMLKNEGGYVEYAGLSTDTKPTGVATGSVFTEVDTGDVYFFNADETDAKWNKMFSLQSGGGGGGGGADVMVVELTYSETPQPRFVGDKTAQEVIAAYSAGTHVVFSIPGSETYGVKSGYASLVGYMPEQEYYGYTDPESFYVDNSASFGNLAFPLGTDGSGYIFVDVYID